METNNFFNLSKYHSTINISTNQNQHQSDKSLQPQGKPKLESKPFYSLVDVGYKITFEVKKY